MMLQALDNPAILMPIYAWNIHRLKSAKEGKQVINFIRAFNESEEHEDLIRLMRRTQMRVSLRQADRGEMQVPQLHTTLTKNVFLKMKADNVSCVRGRSLVNDLGFFRLRVVAFWVWLWTSLIKFWIGYQKHLQALACVHIRDIC